MRSQETLITKLKEGPFAGMFVHAFPCAHHELLAKYTDDKPTTEGTKRFKMPDLVYMEPDDELKALADQVQPFVNSNMIRQSHMLHCAILALLTMLLLHMFTGCMWSAG